MTYFFFIHSEPKMDINRRFFEIKYTLSILFMVRMTLLKTAKIVPLRIRGFWWLPVTMTSFWKFFEKIDFRRQMVPWISFSSQTYYFVIYNQCPSKWCVRWPYLRFFIKNCHFDRSLIKMPINLSRTIRSLSHRHFWTQWITCFQMIYNTTVITVNKKIMVPEPIGRFFLSLIPKSCDSKI